MKRLVIIGLISLSVIALGVVGFMYRQNHKGRPNQALVQPQSVRKPLVHKESPAVVATFNKQQYSIDEPASIWVVANKKRPLQPKEYAPKDLVVPKIPLRLSAASSEMLLRREAATALETMTAAANQVGVHLMLASAYRSYSLQVSVYGSELKSYGQAKADTESARPGFSEHQTGLAADLEPASKQCEIADCFADTPEGTWLAANATTYGFFQRYVPEKSAVTGYRAEAWHYRYVGAPLTAELLKQHMTTLEEFFGLPAAPMY